MSKRLIQVCAVFSLYAVPVSSIAQDNAHGVTQQCLFYGTNPSICDCATDTLSQQLPTDTFAIYNDIGLLAIPLIENGADMGDAYDSAIAETAIRRGIGYLVAMQTNNAAGQAHRDAISSCTE